MGRVTGVRNSPCRVMRVAWNTCYVGHPLHATPLRPPILGRAPFRRVREEGSPVPAEGETTSPADAATVALGHLLKELDSCIEELERARRRARRTLEARKIGRPWLEIVTAEDRPLVVESISSVLGSLARAGHAFRREEAHALQAENISINRIAALFGVTRQRISALVREPGGHPPEEPSS